MNILAIDIGGTAIKSQVYDENGKEISEAKQIPTDVSIPKQTNGIQKQLLALIRDYKALFSLDGVAIDSAGVVDPLLGKIIYAGPTIPNYINTELKAAVEEELELPCWVENDVNAAALGEYWKGAGQGAETLFCATIGTGIGGAIINNGELFHGAHFSAGEVGYLPIGREKWESLASTTRLSSDYQKQIQAESMDGLTFFKDYDNGKEEAQQYLNTFASHIAEGLLPVIYLLNPDRIVLGGGIMERGEVLIPAIKEALSNKIEHSRFLPDVLVSAQLGNAASRLGALYYFLQQEKKGL